MIANSFIPPTLSSLEKKYPPIWLKLLDKIPYDNILRMKLLAGHLTMQNNYQPIITMISHVDFNILDKHDYDDLNYWLANAFFHIGKLIEFSDTSTIFTNPKNGSINIVMNESVSKINEISISNILGQPVYNKSINEIGEIVFKIDLSEYSEGIYIIKLTHNSGRTDARRISYIK